MVIVWQYGSNMDENRLNSGVRLNNAAKFIGLALKRGYKLAFTHTNRCGVGTADVVESDPEDFVIGCLYEIPDNMLAELDRIEGVGSGAYERISDFPVIKLNENLQPTSEQVAVQTYLVAKKENPVTDADYANHILQGIKQHGIGEEYFNTIRKKILENNPKIQKELITYHSK